MPSSPDPAARRLDGRRRADGLDLWPALPVDGGTYVLLMPCRHSGEIRYGRRHAILQQGVYAYVGSAFGPGGLAARLGHHLRLSERPRWHIDHLRRLLPVRRVWLSTEPRHLEHDWARTLAQASDRCLPRFGASDCRCESHLLGFDALPSPELLCGVDAGPQVMIYSVDHD